MIKKILVAIGLIAVCAIPAFGQESKPVGLSVRAGVFFPTNSDAIDAGRTWFVGGAEYKLSSFSLGNKGADSSGSYSISADYYDKGSISNIPVLLNWVGRNNEVFYSVGVGVGFNRDPNGGGGTESKTRLAGQVGIGYDFMQGRSPLFLEAKYFINQESVLNGFGVYVGIHL